MRTATALIFLLVAAMTTPTVGPSSLEDGRTPSDTTSIPFEFVNHIFLRAEINGRPADLLLDPIQNVILDRGFATRMGFPLVGGRDAGYGSEVMMGGAGAEQHVVLFARNLNVRYGTMSRDLPIAPTVPLDSMMANALGRHVDGLLGLNLLNDYVVEIDFSKTHLILHPPHFEPADAVQIPVTSMERRPTIPMRVVVGGDVQEVQSLLDFEMGGTLRFTTRYTDEADLVRRLNATVEIDSETGMGGRLQSRLARLDQLDIAGIKLDDIVASLARETQGADADRPWDALVGLGLLSRFRIFLDLSQERIFLRPGARFDLPFEHLDTGIRFAPLRPGLDRELVIQSVDESSVAARAGLRAGDVILRIEGASAAGWNVRHWVETLDRRIGEKVEVMVRRAGQRVTLELSVVGLI